MKFYEGEISSLAVASIVLALAFLNLYAGLTPESLRLFPFFFLLVGLAFILHELAHKFVAQLLGISAVFRTYGLGLLLAVATSFLGLLFAAPGAVEIGAVRRKAHLLAIAAAGPITNILIAMLASLWNSPLAAPLFTLNVWVALFNLLPIPPLDGYKIFYTNNKIWALLFLIVLGMYLL